MTFLPIIIIIVIIISLKISRIPTVYRATCQAIEILKAHWPDLNFQEASVQARGEAKRASELCNHRRLLGRGGIWTGSRGKRECPLNEYLLFLDTV